MTPIRGSITPLLLALGLVVAGCGSDGTGPDDGGNNGGNQNTIEMRDFSFSPSNLTVQPGTSVTWRNTGAVAHNTTSETGLWASPDMQPDQTFSRTFTTAGTFPYECTLHPGMEGTVTVQ